MTSTRRAIPRVLGVLADGLRVAVLIGAVVTALSSQLEGGVRFALVFLILLAPRLAGLPRPLDFAVCLLLPLATLASVAHWYRRLSWIDWTMHFFTTGAVAAMLYLLMVHVSLLPPLPQQYRASVTLLTAMVGLYAGVLWEFYEWFVEVSWNLRMEVSYHDTIADLAMDAIGSLMAGLTLSMWAVSGGGRYRERLLAVRAGHHGSAQH